jgi:hypothetical protein
MGKVVISFGKGLYKKCLEDMRHSGNGYKFGRVCDLIKQFQVIAKKTNDKIEVSGDKMHMQKLLFYFHHSFFPYEVIKK